MNLDVNYIFRNDDLDEKFICKYCNAILECKEIHPKLRCFASFKSLVMVLIKTQDNNMQNFPISFFLLVLSNPKLIILYYAKDSTYVALLVYVGNIIISGDSLDNICALRQFLS